MSNKYASAIILTKDVDGDQVEDLPLVELVHATTGVKVTQDTSKYTVFTADEYTVVATKIQ